MVTPVHNKHNININAKQESYWPLSFFASIFLGILVFLTTQNAIAGAVLPSLQGGQRLFRTGLWILRNDEEPVRAKVCFAFYLSAAFWMGSAVAFSTFILFTAIHAFTGNNPNMDQLAATMITLASCVAISSLFGLAAIIMAIRNRVRVWVHPGFQDTSDALHLATYDESDFDKFNYAIFVVTTSLAFPPLAIGCAALAMIHSGLLAFIVLLGGPLVTLIAYIWLSSRIIATCPGDCWGKRIV